MKIQSFLTLALAVSGILSLNTVKADDTAKKTTDKHHYHHHDVQKHEHHHYHHGDVQPNA